MRKTTESIDIPTIVGGEDVPGDGPQFEVRNPADPSQVVAVGSSSSPEQASAALTAGLEALEHWAAMPSPDRGEILQRAADIMAAEGEELADLLTREEGKPLADSRAEVHRATDTLRFYAAATRLLVGETLPSGASRQLLVTKREPMGLVVLITPWNFPLAIPTQKVAPALAAGNTVVLKPSTYTPAMALQLSRILFEAGLPRGVMSVVVGSGDEVGGALVDGEGVAAISFTGSHAVGRQIAAVAAPKLIRIQMEMGGKNPLVIMDDADVELATQVASRGTFGLTGQSCTATGRILVQGGVYDAFIGSLKERAKALRVGNGLDPDVDVGPKISRSELQRGVTQVRTATERADARLVWWQQEQDGEDHGGFFFQPAVLSDVDPNSEVGAEELFSPVACMTPFDTPDEAIELCNENRYALAASICTTNLSCAHEFFDRVEAGIVKVNAPTVGLELHMPFGGFKDSSSGTYKELGIAAFDFYTRVKSGYVSY